MLWTRSRFLRASAALAGAWGLSGCTELARRLSVPSLPERLDGIDAPPDDPVERVLSRLGWGPRPGDREYVRRIGVDAWIEEQLAPERIAETPAASLRLTPLDTLEMDASDARDYETATYPEVGQGQAAVELRQARLLRAVYSARRLFETMVEFWTDHFYVSQLKGECSWLKTVDERAIRRHALGRFRDLLLASARSPAMLFYLDNDRNRKRDPRTGAGPNENYARELLELHTLGVDGGYTLRDIQEVARCFTGWSYRQGLEFPPGGFIFRAERHDDGPKRVLGVPLPAGQGVRDGEQVVEILCRHPSTARHIARKLCRRFVADRPPAGLVARVAEVFRRTDGEIRQVLSVLFRSPEFLRGPYRKLKRPFDYVVSALRAVNADTTGAGVLPYLERLGQAPYLWAMPDGYPDRADAWTSGLLGRWQFAAELTANRIPGTSVPVEALVRATGEEEPAAVCRALCRAVLGRSLPDDLLGAMASLAHRTGGAVEAAPIWLALLLSTPEFQWR